MFPKQGQVFPADGEERQRFVEISYNPWEPYNSRIGFPHVVSVVFGAIILLPIRLFIVLLTIVISWSVALLGLLGKRYHDLSPVESLGWRGVWVRSVMKGASRFCLFVGGYYWINHIYLSDENSKFQKIANPLEPTKQTSSSPLSPIPIVVSKKAPPHVALRVRDGDEDEDSSPADVDIPLTPECERLSKDSSTPATAGIIVSNHVSYLDIPVLMATFAPSFVAKQEVSNVPFIGMMAPCLQCVLVKRQDPVRRHEALEIIRKRALSSDQTLPPLVIFSEGTVTNGKCLLQFQKGGFAAGAPVYPVILRYRYRWFNPAWVKIDGIKHMLHMLTSWMSHLDIIHLPIYAPSESEKADPELFAENVRRKMAYAEDLLLVERNYREYLPESKHPGPAKVYVRKDHSIMKILDRR